MFHNLETKRHWSFQTWSRSETRITVMRLHSDANSKFSLLPKEIVSVIVDLADVRVGGLPFVRAQNDHRFTARVGCSVRLGHRVRVPNVDWVRKQLGLVAIKHGRRLARTQRNLHKFADMYYAEMPKVCSWDYLSRWYVQGQGHSPSYNLLVYENIKGPDAATITASLNKILGEENVKKMFIVRDITANNHTGTQVMVLGKDIQYPRMGYVLKYATYGLSHDILFANFSVLHGIDKRITPLRDTPPGKIVRL